MKLLLRYTLCLQLLFYGLRAEAQSCTIIANSKACVGEPLGFKAQSAGTIISYAWDFNGEGSSTGSTPAFIFSTAGNKTVTVILGLSGGLSCTTSFQLKVNEVPKTDFYIDSTVNIYCRSTSKICLKDKTQRSASGAPLKQRIIVWGDGALGQNLNPESDREDCRHYYDTGEFEITMEITDTNMCKSTYRRLVHIEPDLIAGFTYTVTNTCDSVKVCFTNTSSYDPAKPPFFRWYPGDGSVDSVTMHNYCRSYTASGSFMPALVLYNRFGCYDSVAVSVPISISIPQIKTTKSNAVLCASEAAISVAATAVNDGEYTWVFEDSTGSRKVVKDMKKQNTYDLAIPGVGKWYFYVLVKIGGCLRKSPVDSVIVKGPKMTVRMLNGIQCHSADTVRFCVEVDYYRSHRANCTYYWNFGDYAAPNCTTNTKLNQNVGQNCNYSLDSGNVWHFYGADSCFQAFYRIRDTVNGCYDEGKATVSIGEPSADSMQYKSEQPCFSFRRPPEFKVEFLTGKIQPQCGVSKILINTDSAADKNNWKPIGSVQPYYVYDSIADDSGWVSVGLIVKMGEPEIYKACVIPDLNKVGDVCYDTVWYHKFLRLLPEPQPFFFLDKNHGCQPLTVTASIRDSTQRFIQAAYYQWGDSLYDTVYLDPLARHIPAIKHTYKKQGKYFVRITLENTNDCQHFYERKVTVGFSKYLEYDTTVCTNQEVLFKDSIEYWDYETGYWRDSSRAAIGKEKVWWHFGDGSTDTGTAPIKVYKNTGTYEVAMVSVDSVGCYDSSVYKVNVVGVEAGIKNFALDLVCNEIVSFKDSSFKTGSYPGDSIVTYWWDFGDNKIPSVLKDPTHAYTSFGFFTITHVVENIKGCRDTAKINIHMIGPEPRFRFLSDSIGCAPFSIHLENLSDSNSISDYLWEFGDQNNNTISGTSDSNVRFTYTQPGTYYLKLTGSKNVFSPTTGNTYYCTAVYPDIPTHPEKKVIVLPIPLVDFTMPDTVCPGEQFLLVDESDPRYTSFIWRFPFDTLISSTGIETYRIDSPGTYLVKYHPTYTPGPLERLCVDSTAKNIYVSAVFADFEIDSLKSSDPEFFFKNKSMPGLQYFWDFGHPSSSQNKSSLTDPSHYFGPETGTFIICLRAVNSEGCEDTVCKPILIKYHPEIKYYNVFSPGNDDALNDAFDIDIKGETFYHLKIFNRWGSLVFESTEDAENNDGGNWNGKLFNTGPDCAAGTYFYVFEYQILDGEKKKLFATCTLIRDK